MVAGLSIQSLPEEEASADMYRLNHKVLTDAGYEHYEVRSCLLARPYVSDY
jgi:coproporphyrinogen III oxidase-like Fe-S oxidoreductase